MLAIGVEKDTFPCNVTMLPISKISHSKNIHSLYDRKLEKECKQLNLNIVPSYIRVHKVGTVHSNDINNKEISDLKEILPELYDEISELFKTFTDNLF